MISTKYNFVVKLGGTAVKEGMFGVNTLINKDNVGPSGLLPATVEKVGATIVRYPGGTVTEDLFDLTDPNRTSGVGYFTGKVEKDLVPLQSFLSYVEQAGKKALIVLPTYRFFDPLSRDADATAKEEIQTFISDLVSGKYGAAGLAGIEIGNEWYQHRFQWTAAEFGRMQAKIASWVDEAAKQLGVDIPIFVQAGRGDDDSNGINDNIEIAAGFNGETIKAVDGLISHIYIATSTSNPFVLGDGVADRLASVEAVWGQRFGRSFQEVISEWNVGEDGPSNTAINGLMRSAPLVRLFATMVQSGVDIASIWTAQNASPAALSTPESGAGTLTPTGLLFRLLSSCLPDTILQPIDASSTLKSAIGSPVGYSFSFDGDGRDVLVMSSAVADEISVLADIRTLFRPGTHVFGMLLESSDSSPGTSFRSGAQISVLDRLDLDGPILGDGILQFTLAPFSTIFIIVSNDTPVAIQADPQSAVNDLLRGSEWNDILSGFRGDDTIFGFGGNDTISPGTGADTAYGGAGDDLFFVEDHFVMIDGGSGHDVIDFSMLNERIYVDPFGSVCTAEGGELGVYLSIEELMGTDFDDQIFVPLGITLIDGGSGNDFINSATEWGQILLGGGGDDFIFSKSDDGALFGGFGHDKLYAFGNHCQIDGDSGNDAVFIWGNSVTVRDSGGDDVYHLNGAFGLTADFSDASGANIVYGFDPKVQRLLLSDDRVSSISFLQIDDAYGSSSLSILGDDFSILFIGVSEVPSPFFSPDVAYWM